MSNQVIRTHKINDCNRQIAIVAHAVGKNGAPVRYEIVGPLKHCEGSEKVPAFEYSLKFQDGPIADGVNGLTHEVLLAIIENRLMGFQSGPFACERNERTLQHIRAAQQELKARTDERIERGVEGTHTV